ncbi:MAG: hypothetical protein CFH21_00513 [Alphaproteobacteria bacterium MarineAlpha5_Bin11]|nr:hypothetical protein [Pelagibacteraceae bacterium]PPR44077.1 MAG: hypothetical protein CFH21_00513 [Alphaproteobacteria bacterium MarineAlpha5_Bin11]
MSLFRYNNNYYKMQKLHIITVLISSFILLSCSSHISKSGISNTERFSMNFEGLTDGEIKEILGEPSYIDPIDNSYIYYSEVILKKNIFNNKVISRDIYLIKFDNNLFKEIIALNLDNNNELKISKNSTPNKIIKTGILEKIFGGVGKKRDLPGGIPTTGTP